MRAAHLEEFVLEQLRGGGALGGVLDEALGHNVTHRLCICVYSCVYLRVDVCIYVFRCACSDDVLLCVLMEGTQRYL